MAMPCSHGCTRQGAPVLPVRRPVSAPPLPAMCAIGAMPPIGEAYNLTTVVDESLLRLPDLYFDAGDHEDLVHVSGMAFRALLRHAVRGRFSRPH